LSSLISDLKKENEKHLKGNRRLYTKNALVNKELEKISEEQKALRMDNEKLTRENEELRK
jgi:hypothetical protein